MSEPRELDVDYDLLALISHEMKLRVPNAEAVTDIAVAVSDHFDRMDRGDMFEGVIDSATGVGKTYVMAGAIDYLSQARGWSNFVIIVPGRTIREKTIANFTPGSSRDLTGLLGVKTLLVTAENFNTPEMATALANPELVKVYVLTVQTLVKPTPTMNRKTRKFSEGLGAEFYEFLVEADDLVVLADEHHLYYGDKFSDAVRGLRPNVLIGLTATPHAKTPSDQIIYGYPLSAAIADKLVKTPVVVGRKDDRDDRLTQLNDGLTLLEVKRSAQDAYISDHPEIASVNPFMLVVTTNTSEANQIAEMIRSSDFQGGRYSDAVLQVDSSVSEESEPDMWGRLAQVDSPASPIRVVVSVAMLKEGWDVKSVFVLLSTQPSVSKILTEQVLGRGLRLPYGQYVDVEMLNTLEVLAHERFQSLIDKSGSLNGEFVSFRTRTKVVKDQNGNTVVKQVTEAAEQSLVAVDKLAANDTTIPWEGTELDAPGALVISDVETRATSGTDEAKRLVRPPISMISTTPEIILPRVLQRPVAKRFSLADITNEIAFAELGRQLRSNPDDELRRMKLTAFRVTGSDGIVRSMTRQETAEDTISSKATLDMPLDVSKAALVSHVLSMPMVDSSAGSRSVEKSNAQRLVNSLAEGLGEDAESLLAAFGGRAAVRLAQTLQAEQRKVTPGVGYVEETGFSTFAAARSLGSRRIDDDLRGTFSRSGAYGQFAKSRYEADWFDSSTERSVALILDETASVNWWLRLLVGDLTIAWGSGQNYNPDFLVAEGDLRTLVEVKADNQMEANDVQAKRESARKWVNVVNGLEDVLARGEKWSYVLLSESDIAQAKGSWDALKRFG